MIPFKKKPNGIPQNAAVLIILLCITKSCFSFLDDTTTSTTERGFLTLKESRRDIPLKESGNSELASRQETVAISTHIRDVRADSRQSRIDANDIRTDFREIRSELVRDLNNNERRHYTTDYRDSVQERRDFNRAPIYSQRNVQSQYATRDTSKTISDINRERRNYGRQDSRRNTRKQSRNTQQERTTREFNRDASERRSIKEEPERNILGLNDRMVLNQQHALIHSPVSMDGKRQQLRARSISGRVVNLEQRRHERRSLSREHSSRSRLTTETSVNQEDRRFIGSSTEFSKQNQRSSRDHSRRAIRDYVHENRDRAASSSNILRSTTKRSLERARRTEGRLVERRLLIEREPTNQRESSRQNDRFYIIQKVSADRSRSTSERSFERASRLNNENSQQETDRHSVERRLHDEREAINQRKSSSRLFTSQKGSFVKSSTERSLERARRFNNEHSQLETDRRSVASRLLNEREAIDQRESFRPNDRLYITQKGSADKSRSTSNRFLERARRLNTENSQQETDRRSVERRMLNERDPTNPQKSSRQNDRLHTIQKISSDRSRSTSEQSLERVGSEHSQLETVRRSVERRLFDERDPANQQESSRRNDPIRTIQKASSYRSRSTSERSLERARRSNNENSQQERSVERKRLNERLTTNHLMQSSNENSRSEIIKRKSLIQRDRSRRNNHHDVHMLINQRERFVENLRYTRDNPASEDSWRTSRSRSVISLNRKQINRRNNREESRRSTEKLPVDRISVNRNQNERNMRHLIKRMSVKSEYSRENLARENYRQDSVYDTVRERESLRERKSSVENKRTRQDIFRHDVQTRSVKGSARQPSLYSQREVDSHEAERRQSLGSNRQEISAARRRSNQSGQSIRQNRLSVSELPENTSKASDRRNNKIISFHRNERSLNNRENLNNKNNALQVLEKSFEREASNIRLDNKKHRSRELKQFISRVANERSDDSHFSKSFRDDLQLNQQDRERLFKKSSVKSTAFISDEKYSVLINTIQAILAVALTGQIMLSNSKQKSGFLNWQGIWRKQTVF